jgi:hypothetical protein
VTLFDPEEGRRRRDEGMARAEANAPVWRDDAYDLAVLCARNSKEFTSEDVIGYLARAGIGLPSNPRALGAVMNRLTSTSVAFPTDRTMPARRASRHRGSVRIWKSNIYRGT